jgi:polysaccharide export outer membrane protein
MRFDRRTSFRASWQIAGALVLALSFAAFPASALAQSAPAATPYKISPGDQIDVNFRWTPEFNQSVTVQPDGHTVLMSAGDIQAAGLTIQEFHDEIAKHSTDKLLDPEFTVSVKDFEKPHIVVAGEVQTPGRYDLRTATTALGAVLQAGGTKEGGDMAHVILFRNLNSQVAEVHRLSFGKLDRNGKPPSDDMLLQPGDMILVTRDKLANIGRFVKAFNLGVYFNPIPSNGL